MSSVEYTVLYAVYALRAGHTFPWIFFGDNLPPASRPNPLGVRILADAPREGDLATVRTDGPRGSVRPETKVAFWLKQPGVCEMRPRHRAARSPHLHGQQAVARGGRGGVRSRA